MRNLKSVFSILCFVLFSAGASAATVLTVAQQKQIANLNALLKASNAHYATVGAFNTQYAKSVCGANYAKSSVGLTCASKSLDGPTYQTALSKYNQGYASASVIQSAIYQVQMGYGVSLGK